MVSGTVGGPTLHAVRRPATNVVLAARARRSTADPTFRLANTNLRVAASRSHVAAARENRSTFFVSSYTPHTAHRNVYLEHLLRKRSVSYSSELRNSHLQGMVTFLPTGDISHRDFVTHAWADNPIKDILLRMDDSDLKSKPLE